MEPELVSMLIQNGLGAVALVLLHRLTKRLDRVVAAHNEHARDIARLKRHVKLPDDTPPFNRLETNA